MKDCTLELWDIQCDGDVDILPALKGRGFLLQDAHVRARECS